MKKIAFLFTGQTRKNPLSTSTDVHEYILDGYTNFIFTPEIKSQYNYDIFISTDNIDIPKTINYFGIEHVKNIHLHDTDEYYNNINNPINTIDYFINKYNNQDKHGCWSHDSSIYQHYKICDAFNLLENFTNYNEYDYIIKIRLDLAFHSNMLNVFHLFNDPNVEILCDWDTFAIGKPEIMKCFCTTLQNKYGTYTFNAVVNVDPTICMGYNNYKSPHNYSRWVYSPEIQLFETLFEYCNLRNLNINDTIKECKCCRIDGH